MHKTRIMSRLVFLTALTIVFQFIGLPQPITGPFINMMLLLSTLAVSPAAGAALGCLTPVIAVLRGQLPAPLLPMVPFIIAANVLLVVSFAAVRKALRRRRSHQNEITSVANWTALLVAASAKTTLLYLSVRAALPLIFGLELPPPLITAMALPQWVTAITGGALALVLYAAVKRSGYA